MELKFNGKSKVLTGKQVNVGELAPNATMINRQGEEVQLTELLDGQITILSVIPNILTRTCELQTLRLSDETKSYNVQYITVSRNTPQEFNTWNNENELDVYTVTDQYGEFGHQYGLEINIEGSERLARAIFVIDQNGIVQYREIVEELTDEPQYQQPLQIAKMLKK